MAWALMESRIVSINGKPIPEPGKPDTKVVERLEYWLEAARSGEITGFAMAINWRDDATGVDYSGMASYSMVGRLEQMKGRLLDDLKS